MTQNAEVTDEVSRGSLKRELENYWNSGFPAARVVGDTIERGDAWVWASPALANNCLTVCAKTDSATFVKLSNLQVGAPFSLAQIKRVERALLRTGYFSKKNDTKLYRIANRNRIVPVFDFEDATANYAEAAFAYDAESKNSNGYLKINLLNIAGTARDFYIATSRSVGVASGKSRAVGESTPYNGTPQTSAEIFYKEPFIFGTNGSLALHGEFLDGDSLTQKKGDLTFSKKLNWEWQYSVGGGMKIGEENGAENTKYFSSLKLTYDDRDKMPLPFSGLFVEGSAEFSKFVLSGVKGAYLQPFSDNWTLLLSAQGFGMFPAKNYDKVDLFALGGQENFRSLPVKSIYSRTFGLSEIDFEWHGFSNSVLHIFALPGIYRNSSSFNANFNGWSKIYAYGFGFEQGVSSASIALYYTLSGKFAPIDGLLNLGVKVGF